MFIIYKDIGKKKRKQTDALRKRIYQLTVAKEVEGDASLTSKLHSLCTPVEEEE
jgi:hypothetical protein